MKIVAKGAALFACLVLSGSLLNGAGYAAKPLPVNSGTLTGKVTVAGTNTPIEGAIITATGTAGSFSTQTDSKGKYTAVIPAGTYTVLCEADGYIAETSSAVLRDGARTVLNFALSEATVTTGMLTGRHLHD